MATAKDRNEPIQKPTRRHFTTVVLKEQPNGQWLATQRGIPVTGYGETAAEAATNYCRKIDNDEHE